VVMLNATAPGTCLLPGVICPPDLSHDNVSPVARRGIRLLTAPGPDQIPGVLIHAPLVPTDTGLMREVRAAVIDAHAILIVVSWRDVVTDPYGSRARETEARLRGWLPMAAEVAAPGLLTVVVEGAEVSNSHPASRLAWTRREARRALRLSPDWPYDGITELSSRLVQTAAEEERTGLAPPGHQAWAWDSYGVSEVLSRTIGRYQLDPARWFTESALRRARAVFSWAARDLGDRLCPRPPGGDVDPGQALLPRYARQRQSWLAALGLGDWLAAAVAELDSTLGDLAGPEPRATEVQTSGMER
jgi:hypothetical protein